MRNFFKTLKELIILLVILAGISTAIDYTRIVAGQNPLFNIKNYNEKKHIETYRGVFYIATRKVAVSTDEPLVDSSEITFQILTYDLKVPRQFKENTFEFTLETKNEEACTEPKLYYADKDIKIYTFCLDQIKVKETESKKEKDLIDYLKKDNKIIEDIDSKLLFTGLYNDKKTLKYKNDEDEFTNEGLAMYRCNDVNINDIYLAPANTRMREDFCIYKDDDFYWMYEIKDTSDQTEEEGKDVLYEDETYRYEFDTIKKDKVFVYTPAVRGKQEIYTPVAQILQSQILTIDDLINKGLKINKIDKEEERKKLEEEALKAQQEQEQNQTQETTQERKKR